MKDQEKQSLDIYPWTMTWGIIMLWFLLYKQELFNIIDNYR